jgi:hypothetical protein
MAFEKPPRLRGFPHFLAERVMRYAFQRGGSGDPIS